MKHQVTFAEVSGNEEVNTYIHQADLTLKTIGYTEHSFAHVTRTATLAAEILHTLDYDERTVELARIAGYMHDIGNVINRIDHAQSGSVMAFRILGEMGMAPAEIAVIITAIGNHDEHTAEPVNAIAAALILADKSDVRRTRVRNRDFATFDIHDRVNYAVETSDLRLDLERRAVSLCLKIDTAICPVMDYFEIFLNRMMLCRKAAAYLDLQFELMINDVKLL